MPAKSPTQYDERALEAYFEGLDAVAAKEVDLAQKSFEAAASLGYPAAYVELANLAWGRRRTKLVRKYRQLAEEAANAGDALAAYGCSIHYRLMRGDGGPEEQLAKSSTLLELAAELGLSTAQINLAQDCLYGLNGRRKNESEYDKWIAIAINDGDENAVLTHAQNQIDRGVRLSEDILDKLEAIAAENPRAKELLRSVRGG